MNRSISRIGLLGLIITFTAFLPVGAYHVGDRGKDIVLIQSQLKRNGYVLDVDGIYGSMTHVPFSSINRRRALRQVALSTKKRTRSLRERNFLKKKLSVLKRLRKTAFRRSSHPIRVTAITNGTLKVIALKSTMPLATASYRRQIATLAYHTYLAARHQMDLIVPVLRAMFFLIMALHCRAWLMSSMP